MTYMVVYSSNSIKMVLAVSSLIIQGFYYIGSLTTLTSLVVCMLRSWGCIMVWCWNSGYKKLLCVSNSRTMVDLVQKGVNVFYKYENLIWHMKQLLRKDWVVNLHNLTWEKCCRWFNFLAKKGVLSGCSLLVFYEVILI